MNATETMKALLTKAGIKFSNAVVVGNCVHVDTFEKYSEQLQHILTAAGFRVVIARGGVHMDGFEGFRISGRVMA